MDIGAKCMKIIILLMNNQFLYKTNNAFFTTPTVGYVLNDISLSGFSAIPTLKLNTCLLSICYNGLLITSVTDI